MSFEFALDNLHRHVLVGKITLQKPSRYLPVVLKNHAYFMREALREAEAAFHEDEVPVGAVVVREGSVIARGHNQVERLKDPTAHAEMLVLTAATGALGAKWLQGTSVYVTCEPCAMCAGAMVLARVKNLYFGARDPKTGACGSVVNIGNHRKLNHRIRISGGIFNKECGSLLTEFFKKKRNPRSKKIRRGG